MAELTRRRARQQLKAAFYALSVLVVVVGFSALLVPVVKKHSVAKLMSRSFLQKDQGVLLQRDAFSMDDVLPIYGSSELTKSVKNRAGEFFKDAPTGFRVCAVGKAGNTCLVMAEKFAAVGKAMRGRKVVILFSSTWFGHQRDPVGFYEGNFSTLHGMNIALDDSLNADVRRRLAKRMLDFPTTLESQPLLQACLHKIADPKSDGMFERMKLDAMRALLRLSKLIYDCEDQLNTAVMGLCLGPEGQTRSHSATFSPGELDEKKESAYLQTVKDSGEWMDFELLLDLLKSLDAKVLAVSIPFPAAVLDVGPLKKATHDYYHTRFNSECAKRGYTPLLFAEHAGDSHFLIGNTTHFTESGWLVVDKSIDDFYHNRPSYFTKPAKGK